MQRPIAVFDSGVGGLCLLKKTRQLLPKENFLYFADNKNVPYGNKSKKQLDELVQSNVQKMLVYNPKAIVIACNTVTANCIDQLQKENSDVILVGTFPDVEKTKKPCIVFATQSSVNSQKFVQLSKQKDVYVFALKQGAQLIENGCSDDEFKKYLDFYLSGINFFAFESIVLGCTHYIHKKRVFQSFGLPVFDNSFQVAKQLEQSLKMHNLCKKGMQNGGVSFFLSDNSKVQLKKYADFYRNI